MIRLLVVAADPNAGLLLERVLRKLDPRTLTLGAFVVENRLKLVEDYGPRVWSAHLDKHAVGAADIIVACIDVGGRDRLAPTFGDRPVIWLDPASSATLGLSPALFSQMGKEYLQKILDAKMEASI